MLPVSHHTAVAPSRFISSQPLHSTQPIFISIFSLFNYPHLISLAAAAYARTRKPEDQGDIIFLQRHHTFKQTSAR